MALLTMSRNVFRSKSIDDVLALRCFLSERSFSKKPAVDESALKRAKSYESIPRVPMFPFIGSAWAYLPYIGKYSIEEMHNADIHKYKTYGDLVREKFGHFEIVNCYHPDAMHAIMEHDDEHPSRGDFATLKAYRRKRREWYQPAGLLVAEGKEWSELRKTIQNYIMEEKFLQSYVVPLNTIASDFVELIRQERNQKEEVDNAVSLLNKWSLEALSFITLDNRLGCLSPNLDAESDAMKMIQAIETQLHCMNRLEASAGNIPLWRFLPTPTWRKFVQAADTFTSLAFNCLTRSVFEAQKREIGERPTLLQYLTKVEDMGVSSAMVLMADLMMTGIDTTSYAAGFLLYDLAKNPVKQEEAVKELTKLLPTKEDKLTIEKYEQLGYLKNCLKESMRLNPVARGNLRIFQNDVVICGHRIPAGTAVICVLQVVYRNPRYFPSPDMFMPERWDEAKEVSFFQPFGYGARSCVGSKLAELEILTMTTEILRNFVLEYHHGDVGMTTKLINTPDRPLKLRFQER